MRLVVLIPQGQTSSISSALHLDSPPVSLFLAPNLPNITALMAPPIIPGIEAQVNLCFTSLIFLLFFSFLVFYFILFSECRVAFVRLFVPGTKSSSWPSWQAPSWASHSGSCTRIINIEVDCTPLHLYSQCPSRLLGKIWEEKRVPEKERERDTHTLATLDLFGLSYRPFPGLEIHPTVFFLLLLLSWYACQINQYETHTGERHKASKRRSSAIDRERQRERERETSC